MKTITKWLREHLLLAILIGVFIQAIIILYYYITPATNWINYVSIVKHDMTFNDEYQIVISTRLNRDKEMVDFYPTTTCITPNSVLPERNDGWNNAILNQPLPATTGT